MVDFLSVAADKLSGRADFFKLTFWGSQATIRGMNSSKKWSVWDGILDDSKYLKVPDDFWVLFNNLGFDVREFPILYYLFSRVRETNFIVEIDERAIRKVYHYPRSSFFETMKKIKDKLGLVKIKPGVYDMTPVLDNLKIKATIYLTKGSI